MSCALVDHVVGHDDPRTHDEIRLEFMTPAVEKAIEDLPPDEQSPLIEALGRPVSLDLCSWLPGVSRKFRVYRFGIEGGRLRVCYRVLNGHTCVLFAGPHDQYNVFLRRYRGSLPARFVPMSESPIMSKHAKNGPAPLNGISGPQAVAAPTGSAFADAGGLLSPEFVESFKQAAAAERTRAEQNVDTMAELLRSSFGEEMKSLSGRLIRELTALGEGQKRVSDRLAAELRAEIAMLRSEFDTIKLQSGERSEGDDTRRRDLDLAVDGLRQDFHDHKSAAEQGEARVARALDSNAQAVVSLRGELEPQVNQVTAEVSACRESVESLREADVRRDADLSAARFDLAAVREAVTAFRRHAAEGDEATNALADQMSRLEQRMQSLGEELAQYRANSEASVFRGLLARGSRVLGFATKTST